MKAGALHPHVGPKDGPCWQMIDVIGTCKLPSTHSMHDEPLDEMTREQKVNAFIRKWQPRLGLQAWDIRYNPNRKSGKGTAADMSRDETRRLCEIRIDPNCPDSELENNVLHELGHLVVGPLEDMAKRLAGTAGGKGAGTLLMDMVHDTSERMIEQWVAGLTGRRQTVLWWHKKQMAMFQPPEAA